MKRDTHSIADYSDYSYFYDHVFGSGAYWIGTRRQARSCRRNSWSAKGYFQKWSHELRVSHAAQILPVKATVGVVHRSASCTTSANST